MCGSRGGTDFQFSNDTLIATGTNSYTFTESYKKCLAIWGKYGVNQTSQDTTITNGTVASSTETIDGVQSGYHGGGRAVILTDVMVGAVVTFPSAAAFAIYSMD